MLARSEWRDAPLSTTLCGGGGIRTHERLKPLPIFKTGAFNRSATPPFEILDGTMLCSLVWASAI
jgi:hypothetical protein